MEALKEKLKFITESTCKIRCTSLPLLPNSLTKGPCPGEMAMALKQPRDKRNSIFPLEGLPVILKRTNKRVRDRQTRNQNENETCKQSRFTSTNNKFD